MHGAWEHGDLCVRLGRPVLLCLLDLLDAHHRILVADLDQAGSVDLLDFVRDREERRVVGYTGVNGGVVVRGVAQQDGVSG